MSQGKFQETNSNAIAPLKFNDPVQLLKTALPHPENFVSYETKIKIEGVFDEATLKLFKAFQQSYNFFRTYLFCDSLSPVVLTLNRTRRSAGYFMDTAWIDNVNNVLPEINISPYILEQPSNIVMSVLVHEMAHHFQYLHGKPGRGRYHNKQFAKIMMWLGLMCSATGLPGGRMTGDRMPHYIIDGGRFQQVFNTMPPEFVLPFKSFPYKRVTTTQTNKNKTTYRCGSCDTTLWGRPNQNALCGNCFSRLIQITD